MSRPYHACESVDDRRRLPVVSAWLSRIKESLLSLPAPSAFPLVTGLDFLAIILVAIFGLAVMPWLPVEAAKSQQTDGAIKTTVPFLSQTALRNQTDEQDKPYLLGNSDILLSEKGCGVASLAMVYRYYGVDVDVVSFNERLRQTKGFSGGLLAWDKPTAFIAASDSRIKGIERKQTSNPELYRDRLNAALDQGEPVIVRLNNQHYVVVVARDARNESDDQDDIYYINDPWAETPEEGYGIEIANNRLRLGGFDTINQFVFISAEDHAPRNGIIVTGAIADLYRSVLGSSGTLGNPLFPQLDLPENGGTWQEFEGGAIFAPADGETRVIYSPLWEKVKNLGGFRQLGLPLTSNYSYFAFDTVVWRTDFADLSLLWPENSAPSDVTVIDRNNGVRVQYFANADLAGAPVLERWEQNMLWYWQKSSPGPGLANDQFSARFTETFHVGGIGWRYRFLVQADDGVRVYMDGELILDLWDNNDYSVHKFAKNVGSGEHELVVEYRDTGGDAKLVVSRNTWPNAPVFADPAPWSYETLPASAPDSMPVEVPPVVASPTPEATKPLPTPSAQAQLDLPMYFLGTLEGTGETTESHIEAYQDTQVVVSGNYAYLTSYESGLHIVDVSDPRWPRRVSSLPIGKIATRVALAGQYAYVYGRFYGSSYPPPDSLVIIDVSNPESPTIVKEIPLSPTCRLMQLVEHYLWLPCDSDRHHFIWDVSNPADPTLIADYEYPGTVIVENQMLPAPDRPLDQALLAVRDNRAYLVSNESYRVFDLAAPATTLTQEIVAEDFWSGSKDMDRVEVVGNTLYIAGATIDVLEILDDAPPRVLGSWDDQAYDGGRTVPAYYPMDIEVEEDFLYLASYRHGLSVFDISEPANITWRGSLTTPFWWTRALTVVDDLVYLASGDGGLRIAQVGSPDIPTPTPQPTVAVTQSSSLALPNLAGRLVFLSSRDHLEGEAYMATLHPHEIYAMWPDGSDPVRLVPGFKVWSNGRPLVSPDGNEVMIGNQSPERTGTITIFSTSAPPVEIQLPNPRGQANLHSLSQDGTRILMSIFWSEQSGEASTFVEEIFTYNRLDGTFTRLTNDTLRDWYASWSPDGQSIVFMRDYEMWMMNADGSSMRRLIEQEARAVDWSPDGSMIAFEGQNNEAQDLNYDIWVVKADGTEARNLTNTPDKYEWDPVWSPDGTRILFERTDSPNGVLQIFVLELATMQIQQLTDIRNNYAAFWVPGDAPTTAVAQSTPDSAAALDVSEGEAGSSTTETGIVTASQLNVRAAPIDGEVLTVLTQGAEVGIVGRSADGAWLQILLPDQRTGWVAAEFIAISSASSGPPPATTNAPETLPTCSISTHPALVNRTNRALLGCPRADAFAVWSAWQPFERGHMFWREDTNRAYAFYRDGRWEVFGDTWDGSETTNRYGTPPANLQAPVRGFGYIWEKYDAVFSAIGWATDIEKGVCILIQEFDNGSLLVTDEAVSCNNGLYSYGQEPDFWLKGLIQLTGGSWQYP